jgi:hypothetical protein
MREPAEMRERITPDGFRYKRNEQGGITVTKYTGSATDLVIPAAIEDLPVTEIGDCVFRNRNGLTGATIPAGVTSIGNDAFAYCGGLTGVIIGVGVRTIGNFAFLGCRGLTGITIPDSVRTIGKYAFYGCESLASVTIGSGVTAIGNSAFEECGSLTSITVDRSNTDYAGVDGVLFNNNKTTLVAYPAGRKGAYTVPAGVTAIGVAAFALCSAALTIRGYDTHYHANREARE